jgi:ABC-2 type transport system ATP-binding protein
MSPPQEANALEFLATSKWYGQVSALTDVSVRFGPGVWGLIGQNGAGKSTLIKLAAGLLRPSHGEVRLLGMPPTRPAARRHLGYCPDIDRYYEDLAGRRFVEWMLRLGGGRRRVAAARARALLVELGLEADLERPIREYSKGMRQRVKLAVALGRDPAVLLLDEPLTGLDPVARQEMLALLRRRGAAGACVVVSSHVLHELQSVVDGVVVIHQGRKLAEGRVGEIREQMLDRPRRFFLGSDDPRRLAARLFDQDAVVQVLLADGGVEMSTGGGAGVDAFLTGLGADGLLREILPLDENLESVFGYLVQ